VTIVQMLINWDDRFRYEQGGGVENGVRYARKHDTKKAGRDGKSCITWSRSGEYGDAGDPSPGP